MQQFDLFTFIATIINFVILVALLRIFLYKRVLEVVQKRQEEINGRWKEAEKKGEEAEKEKENYKTERERLNKQENEILKQKQQEAEEKKKELLAEAKEEIEEKKQQWRRSLERREKSLTYMIRKNITDEVITLTKRVIDDLADEKLENKIFELFIDKIKTVEEKFGGNEKLTVRSSFTLQEEQKEEVKEILAREKKNGIHFEVDDKMMCGLELAGEEIIYAWHAGDYIDRVEEKILSSAERKMV